MRTNRTEKYLRTLASFPLALLRDPDGHDWTWAEGRTAAVAVRGVVPGLPGSTVLWGNPATWRGTMTVAFAANRKRTSRLYMAERLREWCGEPWVPPHDPCPHCHGTGRRHGTTADLSRAGALQSGVMVDRNLLARVLALFEPGAIVVDVRRSAVEDPIRIRSLDGEVRAVVARMRGSTEGLLTFEDEESAREDGSLALAAVAEARGPDLGLDDHLDDVLGEEEPRRAIGDRERECGVCGGELAGGVCESCGAATGTTIGLERT